MSIVAVSIIVVNYKRPSPHQQKNRNSMWCVLTINTVQHWERSATHKETHCGVFTDYIVTLHSSKNSLQLHTITWMTLSSASPSKKLLSERSQTQITMYNVISFVWSSKMSITLPLAFRIMVTLRREDIITRRKQTCVGFPEG